MYNIRKNYCKIVFLKNIYRFGDKTEDKIRGKLSHTPIIYAIIGGTGTIIFWRGIWVTMDYLMECLTHVSTYSSSISTPQAFWWDGPLSIAIGLTILLLTGLLVPDFIGSEIILSGLKGEKKTVEKTEEEVRADTKVDIDTMKAFKDFSKRLKNIEKKLKI